jgi:hypothetical protein
MWPKSRIRPGSFLFWSFSPIRMHASGYAARRSVTNAPVFVTSGLCQPRRHRLSPSNGREGDRALGQASPRRPQAPPLANRGKQRAYGEKDDLIRRKYVTLFSFARKHRFAERLEFERACSDEHQRQLAQAHHRYERCGCGRSHRHSNEHRQQRPPDRYSRRRRFICLRASRPGSLLDCGRKDGLQTDATRRFHHSRQ